MVWIFLVRNGGTFPRKFNALRGDVFKICQRRFEFPWFATVVRFQENLIRLSGFLFIALCCFWTNPVRFFARVLCYFWDFLLTDLYKGFIIKFIDTFGLGFYRNCRVLWKVFTTGSKSHHSTGNQPLFLVLLRDR